MSASTYISPDKWMRIYVWTAWTLRGISGESNLTQTVSRHERIAQQFGHTVHCNISGIPSEIYYQGLGCGDRKYTHNCSHVDTTQWGSSIHCTDLQTYTLQHNQSSASVVSPVIWSESASSDQTATGLTTRRLTVPPAIPMIMMKCYTLPGMTSVCWVWGTDTETEALCVWEHHVWMPLDVNNEYVWDHGSLCQTSVVLFLYVKDYVSHIGHSFIYRDRFTDLPVQSGVSSNRLDFTQTNWTSICHYYTFCQVKK